MRAEFSSAGHDELVVCGRSIADIIQQESPASLVLLLGGVSPEPWKTRLVNALLVAAVDHGLQPPSAVAVRLVASVGGDMQKALIAGLSCMGEIHAPGVSTWRFFKDYHAGDPLPKRVPGFGHPIHTSDPRVPAIRRVLAELGKSEILDVLTELEGRLPVKANYAAVLAVCCLAMGLNEYSTQLILTLGRTIGLTAHYSEQKMSNIGPLSYDQNSEKFI